MKEYAPMKRSARFLLQCCEATLHSDSDFILHAPQGALHCNQKNSSRQSRLHFLVAEMGFEPHDLEVMSLASYQAAPLRDICFFRAKVIIH